MKLWIDDQRPPPDPSWTWVKNALDAIGLLRFNEFDEVSLDHDLGNCGPCEGCKGFLHCGCQCHLKGRFIVNWMAIERCWPKNKPTVHCRGPENAKYMVDVINRYFRKTQGDYNE